MCRTVVRAGGESRIWDKDKLAGQGQVMLLRAFWQETRSSAGSGLAGWRAGGRRRRAR